MSDLTLAVLAVLVLGWSVVSERLAKWNVTGPLFFTAAGFLLANDQWGLVPVEVDAPSVHALAEITLALLLFSDAARVNLSVLRRNLLVPSRLLGIGLPLTVILGSVTAALIFHDFTWALAGFVGAALAPTDAALSSQVINDASLPLSVRRALNVESGLNDGIVTPIVVFCLAVAAGQLGVSGDEHAEVVIRPLFELGLGIVVGTAIGFAAAGLIGLGSRFGWTQPGGRRLAALAAAVASFTVTITLDGNGFIAAFVAGITFGSALPRSIPDRDTLTELPELGGELLALVVWFFFGAVLVPLAFEHFSLTVLLYAFLSLTVLRILPVALALISTPDDRATVLFMGWFGPRGLASVVFALIAIEQLGTSDVVDTAIAAVTLTVLLSVVAHGISAGPLGRRFERREQDPANAEDAPRARKRAHD
ncbi:cation:proton antiporter [Leifsonia poae]|uniref:Sodium:proton antiporter n=1 Tax=Leifsonia poae TaxID=110933 RepID=A0A9W6HAF9_9MICO|nr:cation:proton antiporter [Leifsonia poae]GLJ76510.1 sodium:proton antiporter [Leifsonia poae]